MKKNKVIKAGGIAEDEKNKNIKPPETIFQLIKTMIVGIFRNLPKMVIWMLIRAAVSFAIVLFINAYVIAYINEGTTGSIPRESPWFYLLNLASNRSSFNILSFLVFFVISSLYTRIRTKGLKTFFTDLFQTFAWTVKSLDAAGKAAIPILLIFTGIAFYARIFTENRYVFLTLAVGVFLLYTMRDGNMTMMTLKLAWSDMQRLFASGKPKKPLNVGAVAIAIFGIFTGILILVFIPFNMQAALYIAGGLLIALGILVAFRKVKPSSAMFILGTFALGYTMYLLKTAVIADDGGWQELGGNMDSFLASGQGKDVIRTGTKPGFFASVGSFLGGLLSSGASVVTGAYDYTAEKAGEAYNAATSYVYENYQAASEFVLQTYDKIADKVSEAYDDASKFVSETYEKVSEFAAETYEKVSEIASETYEKVSEFASETYEKASNFAAETYESIVENLNYAGTFTKEFFKAVGSDFAEAGRDIADFATKAYNTASDVLGGIADFASDAWNDPSI
ncbi:MAG: hypothetical protein PHG48_02930, partial [Eubacteriales bacterium]|nr:hypothetical protein [Eubacteriales bacterium]